MHARAVRRGSLWAVAAWLASGLLATAQAFDPSALNGLWAESLRSRFACTPTNRYQRFELSADGRRLVIAMQHGPEGRKHAEVELTVTRSDEHSLYLVFKDHNDPSDPLAGEWALTLLGPGAYRWHLASEHEGLKPAPIGVRCGP